MISVWLHPNNGRSPSSTGTPVMWHAMAIQMKSPGGIPFTDILFSVKASMVQARWSLETIPILLTPPLRAWKLPPSHVTAHDRSVCLQPLSSLLSDCPIAGETARLVHAFFNEKPSPPLPCTMCPGEPGGCRLLPAWACSCYYCFSRTHHTNYPQTDRDRVVYNQFVERSRT